MYAHFMQDEKLNVPQLKRELVSSFSQPGIVSLGKKMYEFTHGLPQVQINSYAVFTLCNKLYSG